MDIKRQTRQATALEALLSGSTQKRAAGLAGVSEKTLCRWLDRAEFRDRLTQAQSERLSEVTRHLLAISLDAVDALGDILDDPGQYGANVRRLCAGTILENASRFSELHTLDERIAALEERLA
jgi:hypothetical protein